jgi:hypothetical protein
MKKNIIVWLFLCAFLKWNRGVSTDTILVRMKDPLKHILARSSSLRHTPITLRSPAHHCLSLAPCPKMRQSLMLLQCSKRSRFIQERRGLVSKLIRGARVLAYGLELAGTGAAPAPMSQDSPPDSTTRNRFVLRWQAWPSVVPSAWHSVRRTRKMWNERGV